MNHASYLLIGAAVAAISLFGPAPVQADPFVVTSTVPSPPVGYTMGGYMSNKGGILIQLQDGSGNFVNSSTPLPIQCISGCSGGTGGGGGTVTQGPGGTNTSPWFVSPGTSTFPISGTIAVSGTSTVVLNSAITATVNQGVQGTNTSPWFVSPGTNTFPITGNLTGTSTFALGGTGTVVVAGASQPPLTGTSTVVLNSSPTVVQGAGGTNTSPWFVSPGTSTFPVSGTLTAIPGAGTSTVVCASGCSGGTGGGGTVTQGPQGTNTSPWFVSPGTSTFPVSGTVAVSTATVGGSVSLTGTSTVVLNSNITVNQGTVAGTNTAPWFVSPGTSTFPITGVLTGTSTVVQGGATQPPLSGTTTVVQVNGATVVVSGTVTSIPGAGTSTVYQNLVSSTAGTVATQDINIQQIGGTGLNTAQIACGTVATVLAAARTQRQTITMVNMSTNTVFIGGTAVTTAGGFPLLGIGASLTLPDTIAFDCIASATSTVAIIETF